MNITAAKPDTNTHIKLIGFFAIRKKIKLIAAAIKLANTAPVNILI